MNTENLTIQRLGPKGDGVCFESQGNIYVEGAMPGDRVKAKLFRDKQGVSRGEILKVLVPSEYRQKPPCVHYESCGNCTVQHVSPDFYRHWKMEIVKEAFQKQNLRPRQWLTPVFLEGPNRRRATLTAVKSAGKIKMGYYRRRSQEIIDIDSCLVIDPRILELRNKIKPLLSKLLKENVPTDFFVQVVGDCIEVTPNILGKSSGPLIAEFGVLKVALPKEAFLQPTIAGEKALVSAVMKVLPTKGKYADLFAGCGTFTGSMLSRGPVSAYESVPQAVGALAKAGEKFPLKVFKRDLFKNPLKWNELNHFDAVVFDPPRAGCPEQALEMSDSKVGVLVGVSCNPATFARDARILCEGGYWLQSLQVFDQFLWSHHVEVVGVFTKKKRVS